jgi:Domain of unknown function (DUF1902)
MPRLQRRIEWVLTDSSAGVRLSSMSIILVKAEWDSESKVWVAHSDDVPGLVAESSSLEKLRPRVLLMIEELIVLNKLSFGVGDIPVHFVAQTTDRLKIPAAV